MSTRKSICFTNPAAGFADEDSSEFFSSEFFSTDSKVSEESGALNTTNHSASSASPTSKASKRAAKIKKEHRRIQKIRRDIRKLRERSQELEGKKDEDSLQELEMLSSMEDAMEDMKYISLRESF